MDTENGRITVLVVEDDPELAELYETFLADRFSVRTAIGGQAALDRTDEGIDVILLDRRMPEVDGDQVARTLRARGFEQPIAMLTGMRPDDEVLDLPVDDYLIKPVDRESLLDTVRSLAHRAEFADKSREFFRLVSKREAFSAAADGGSAAAARSDRVRRLSELRAELDETMANMLSDEVVDVACREPTDEEVEELLADVIDHPLPPDIAEIVEEYQSLQDARPPFMWKWVHRLAPQNTLPVVEAEYRSRVPVDKTLTILFITLLDDRMEKRGDRETFAELAKIPAREQRAQPLRSGVDADYLRFTRRVWTTLLSRLEQAPSFETYEDLFRFDVKQAITAIEYSDIAINDPGLATMGDLERFESHNMVMLAYADIDLMHAETDYRDDLSDIREVVWIAQLMARIGNWVSTWERELREGDWSSGPVVSALEQGVFTRSELRRSASDPELQDELVERVYEHGIEREFLTRWERYYHDLRELDESLSTLDLGPFIDGTEEVLRYHLASRGLK